MKTQEAIKKLIAWKTFGIYLLDGSVVEKEKMWESLSEALDMAIEALSELPRVGKWVYEERKRLDDETDDGPVYVTEKWWKCSKCGFDMGFLESEPTDKFCPQCGDKKVLQHGCEKVAESCSRIGQPYTESEIKSMQDLEQAQLDKAYELGWKEGREALEKEIWEDGRDRLD